MAADAQAKPDAEAKDATTDAAKSALDDANHELGIKQAIDRAMAGSDPVGMCRRRRD